jgi:Asp-tRNA(Asn)/Glu-tRNA(Gln) amidotransferase A subunit family amidase
MVPGAIGSQTNGSVVRPASYCGVYGYKPTHGVISRHGMLAMSRALDHPGVFARSLADVAAVAEPLMGYDSRDPDMQPLAAPGLNRLLASEPPVPPRFAFVRTPAWDKAGEDIAGGLGELAEVLGGRAGWVELPASAAHAWDWHRTIVEADIAVNLEREHRTGAEAMSARLKEMIEGGRKVTAFDYKRAIASAAALRLTTDEIFGEADAIVTPAAYGEAPVGLDSTGDPVFCTIWSLLGLPVLSLPLLSGRNGLPVGVQIVGRARDDARLFRTARWLIERVEAATHNVGAVA